MTCIGQTEMNECVTNNNQWKLTADQNCRSYIQTLMRFYQANSFTNRIYRSETGFRVRSY